MEAEGEFKRKLKELQCQLRNHKAAVEELGVVLHQRAQGVLGRDQAVSLDDLKARIKREVHDVQITEMVASNKFIEGKLTTGIMNFAVGALCAAIAGKENPLYRGASLFKSALGQKAPFDTVLIAIGNKGLPEDVIVLPLSSLARDYNRSETAIEDAFRERGYLLMTPQTFVELVDNLKPRVLDRSVSLPLSVNKIATELSRITRRPRLILGS